MHVAAGKRNPTTKILRREGEWEGDGDSLENGERYGKMKQKEE